MQYAFEYLENRISGNCHANYDCTHVYEMMRLFQVFFPLPSPTFCAPAPAHMVPLLQPLTGLTVEYGCSLTVVTPKCTMAPPKLHAVPCNGLACFLVIV